ncbi:UDP-glucose 4-epimerase GalE [Sphingomicrobium astaxanthinifaciens]|uniref:UDP-glucose 4-epimerase GalE n=1 Tax=Sphingomicrobium astaxanthinifaciens TaxID=1227949 RepID=UPI001FCA638B|nr:UDP-glucose 4-epimerase GalE [Sphingomicrobium astaxanthinifaciens]MCJ7420504.1 UDP-glucose 4-epimerase GalE [Sphingomicrobium astaxanthinifaciens]
MSQTILLTGGAGFIGSHCALALLEAGHRVVILDNFATSDRSVVAAIRALAQADVPLVEADIRDRCAVAEALRAHGVDAVVHLAALKAVAESVERPLAYYDNNVGGMVSLLAAMDEVGVRQLIYSSSATVYGEPEQLPLREDHPLRATNPYGQTKLVGEQLLADLAAADERWRVVSLRYFNPVGAHPSGLIGENPKDRPNNLMPLLVRAARGRRDGDNEACLSVFGTDYPTPDGSGARDYLHVMDLAAGHCAALSALRADRPPVQAFNLGTGRGTSVLELIATFERVTGHHVPYRLAERRPGDVAELVADPAAARDALGWVARRGVEAMCRDSWQFATRGEAAS